MPTTDVITPQTLRHDAIMNFMIAQPEMKVKEIAAHFRVSPQYLSILIHTDAFQAQLAKKKEALFQLAIAPIAEKLTYLGHQVIERMIDKVPVTEDPQTLLAYGEFALDRVLYEGRPVDQKGPNGGPLVNVTFVSANLLAEARERILSRNRSPNGREIADSPSQEVPGSLEYIPSGIDE